MLLLFWKNQQGVEYAALIGSACYFVGSIASPVTVMA
jgi:hypothetical protein